MPRALVIHPGALGDVLLALPALAHLRALEPGRERVVAAAPRLAALLRGSAYAESTIGLDALGLHGLFTAEGDPVAARRLEVYDPIVSWLGAGDPVYRRHLAALGGSEGRRVVVARARPDAAAGRHASRHYLETLAPLGPPPEDVPPVRLAARPAERERAAGWLAERELPPGEVVLVHPGAGSPLKVWPGCPVLAGRLVRAGLPVVAVTGPADAEAAAALAAHAGLPESRMARDWPLGALAALLERAVLFVGHDSGLSHLAAAVGTPSLVVFGPTDPRVWAPLGDHVTVLAGGRGPADPWGGLAMDAVEQAVLEAASRRRADVA